MSIERSTNLVRSPARVLANPIAARVAGVVAFALLTALSARLMLPVPGTAVPFTFQTAAVLLSGALLGARLGAASQLLYLSAGLLGLPVFATGAILGPTGGYLIAFPLAAYLVGALSARTVARSIGAMLLGLATIYAGGIAWLAILFDGSNALAFGLLPFLLADLVKVAMAGAISLQLRERARSLFQA